ncbi:condensation domain-containing protein, partial [Streptomyces jumonjinensis]
MHELIERVGAEKIDQVIQSALVVAPAGLDFAVLTDAVRALAGHHDTLRARLEHTPQPRLVVPEELSSGPFTHRVDAVGGDLRRLVDEETRAAVARLDPWAGVMVQAVWFDLGPDTPGRLLLVVHHLVVDTVSFRVLLPDLAEVYEALADGQAPALQSV